MMGDYHDEPPSDALPDDYAALTDAREVMREVIGLVEELRGSAKKLGDAIAAAGFPAREWVSVDAELALLGEQFPEISLDAFLTRLAEFAAGMGPAWLHGGEDEIAQFIDEAQILDGVTRPLRVFAQRQRMLPMRERGELPLAQVFGDGRVGTQLDLLAGYLRDLDALSPYIVPLTPSEWDAVMPAAPASQPAPQPAPPPADAHLPPVFSQQQWLLSTQPQPAVSAQPVNYADTPQTYSRLRDFAPSPSSWGASPAAPNGAGAPSAESSHVVVRVPNGRGMLKLLLRHRWLVLGIIVLVLSAGTGLLSLAALRTHAIAPASHLTATPATLHLTCSGKGATATLTLRDTGKAPISWTLQPPASMRFSTTRGSLKPGATATLTATSVNRAASRGTLTFAASDGTLAAPYTIACP